MVPVRPGFAIVRAKAQVLKELAIQMHDHDCLKYLLWLLVLRLSILGDSGNVGIGKWGGWLAMGTPCA